MILHLRNRSVLKALCCHPADNHHQSSTKCSCTESLHVGWVRWQGTTFLVTTPPTEKWILRAWVLLSKDTQRDVILQHATRHSLACMPHHSMSKVQPARPEGSTLPRSLYNSTAKRSTSAYTIMVNNLSVHLALSGGMYSHRMAVLYIHNLSMKYKSTVHGSTVHGSTVHTQPQHAVPDNAQVHYQVCEVFAIPTTHCGGDACIPTTHSLCG
mmetsp:Transcript_11897/g.25559  ORF Transcript_11897/g.25559 Transcript_11897/m.25559 type:complete len:212 (+) Transcript_11897:215-850(+)